LQKNNLQIVILAGGTGTRLWPLSRKAIPKQFQPLVGSQTLFQLAVSRAKKIVKPENIFVATNQQFVSLVKKQASIIPARNILAEPAFCDTATCLGYAATVLEARNPGGVMSVLYADHLIADEAELKRKILAAAEVAATGKLAIIEIESEFPSTQFGWVEVGKSLGKFRGEEVLQFRSFHEKPDLPKAQKFHAAKNFFWNTGLYVWKTDVLLSKFQAHLPDTFTHLRKIAANLKSKSIITREYSACEKISIDYGIMEKVNPAEVAILPAKLGWSDVGNFASLKDELSKPLENLVENESLAIDATGNFVKTKAKKFIALLGVKDLIVIDSGDALLICDKSKAGEVKKVVQYLESKGKLL
jgi:mannose-1-phosphate guanylyltransferase